MMRLGYVVATHPEDYSVDLVMADDGSRMVGVQVMTGNGSTRSGSVDLPAVPDKADKWDVTKLTGQDMKAVVSFIGRQPVVAGFLFPQVSQMTMADPKTRLFRHQSDVVSVIDGDGNIDLRHPSGFSIRIGETPDHRDPAGANADGNLALDRNTGRRAFLRVSTGGGTAVLTITPDGEVSLTCDKTVMIDAKEAVTVKTPESVTLDTPQTTCTGNLTVVGSLSVQGVGINGAVATITGGAHFDGGNVTHNSKNIGSTHTHGASPPPNDAPVS